MESQKQDEVSDEDIPSDFFDDFNKDEFIEGLSVIDSWDVQEGVQRKASLSRLNSAVGGVRDLRELIRDGRDDELEMLQHERYESRSKRSRYEYEEPHESRFQENRRDSSCSRMDNYIKPGSRRDLRKTNEAIRKDKQVKVKEYLSKHLDSIDDPKPPGTELDDFLNEPSTMSKRKNKSKSPDMQYVRYPSKEFKYRISPRRHYQNRERYSAHWSPREKYYTPHQLNNHYSPHHKVRYHSPSWRSRRHYSPHYNPRQSSRYRRSPVHRSPSLHSPTHRSRGRSRTPTRYEKHSPVKHKDSFLYPSETPQTSMQVSVPNNPVPYQSDKGKFYLNSTLPEYPATAPGYSYVQGIPYPCAAYDYQVQSDTINHGLVQTLSTQVINSGPPMVPPPQECATAIAPAPLASNMPAPQEKPFDALAKLVIEGKISKEDYLKLTPNKGTYKEKPIDTHVKAKVLNRCIEALAKLTKLELPNRLLISTDLIGQETKSLTPKFCSPLKRQEMVDFNFTKTNGKTDIVQQNRQVIDSIISTIGLTDLVSRPKKLNPTNSKDAAVQTTKPFCEVCLIRDSTKTYEAGTSTDVENFTSTVHTQVVEQDLMSSKSVFNPSGCVTDNEHISIAHLTPAQLVSQLAARAKTLQQSNPVPRQFNRRNPGNNYGGGGGNDDNFYGHPYH